MVKAERDHEGNLDAGVSHDAVIRHLLLNCDAEPDKTEGAIRWAVEDGLIHAPEPNHYRATPLTAAELRLSQ